MNITWTPNGSETPTTLRNLNQVAAHSTTELKSCRQALEDAQKVLESAFEIHAILLRLEDAAPRFRHDRVEDNIRSIMRIWDSFEDWTGGQLSRLCLLTKPDVDRVVRDTNFREVLRSRLTAMAAPQGFTAKIKKFNTDTSFLVQSMRHCR